MDPAVSERERAAPVEAPLRVGAVLDPGDPPAWVARILCDLQRSGEAHLVAVIRCAAPEGRGAVVPGLLHRLYDAVDARLFPLASDPFAPVDVADAIGDAAVVAIADLDAPSDDELAAFVAQRLDVVLELGSRRLRGRALGAARFGVWSYAHGEACAELGGPAGFWEVMTEAPVTASALVQRSPHGEQVLYRSWSSTDPSSVRRSRANVYWKSSAFVMRALRELCERGRVERRAGPATVPPASPPPAEPSAARVIAGLARFGATLVRDRARGWVTRKQWLLAYGIDERRGDVPSLALDELAWIVPPRDRIWADPFVARHGDGWVVLFEEKRYVDRNAWISAIEIDRSGRLGEPYPVLTCDYHLSYPFLLHWNGAWWMVPESARANTIDLWRATEFPRRWTRERTLLAGVAAVDATLLEHAGRWWMFCNIGEPGASKDDELHLFHADTPLGPWTAHRRNPIKSDIRSARSAGRPFWQNGAWHRPAQDSAAGYGTGIVVHRIDQLDVDGYAETEVERLTTSFAPGLVGLHTLNAAGGLTVIDLRMPRSRLGLAGRGPTIVYPPALAARRRR
jgi:hypothetical protein